MRVDYDFSNAERGRFYRPNAVRIPPIHLDTEVLAFLTKRAEARGVSLSELVNRVGRRCGSGHLVERGRRGSGMV